MPLAEGHRIGPYEIVAPLGAGGMGEVYRATDTRLGRDVALKVLPSGMAGDSDRLARFQREARAVAALNHPNLVTLYSVEQCDGVHFLTMELIEGQPLDRMIAATGLPADRIIAIAAGIAEALAAAHDKGIVHRDLKPANIMVTQEGRVKVLDFGLARDTAARAAEDATLTSAGHTQAGMVMGTPAYMSPEQLSSRPLDHRTDIFSLGVVLHEMSTGSPPFGGTSSAELISAILRDTPPPVTDLRADLPADLARVIRRCLEKDPRHRMQTARDVSNEFRDMAGMVARQASLPAAPARPAVAGSGETRAAEGFWVAVLPFRASGSSADLKALAEGLSEEIITGLSRFSYLRVVARGSTVKYLGEREDIRAIGKELGARYVMEGSLRQAGNKLRVSVQLTDTASGTHLWAENYERPFDPGALFELQDDLVPPIVSTVADMHGVLPRTISDALRSRSEDSLTPHEALLRSFSYFFHSVPEEHAAVRAILERAVRQAPDLADAWAMLAMMYFVEFADDFNLQPNPLERGLAAAERAVSLAPAHALGHYALAFVHFFRKEWVPFRAAVERAVALNPMDGSVIGLLGITVDHSGDEERGKQMVETAMRLNPNHPGIFRFVAFNRAYRNGRYEEALEAAVRINLPGFFYYYSVLAAAHGQLGQREAAQADLDQLLRLRPNFASEARREFLKWWTPEIAEQMIEGLRKAGLPIPDALPVSAAPSASGPLRTASGVTRADEGFWVAVLPFRYTGANADLQALAEGISDEVVTGLSRFSYLRVIARGATARYSGESAGVRVIGNELGARYVMEGSLRQAGTRLRLTVQLADTLSGAQLWAETYERAFAPDALFELQDDLVPRIVSTVADQYGVLPRSMSLVLRGKAADDLTPYEAVLRAFSYFSQITPEEHKAMRDILERAVRKAPSHADAWAMLSMMYRGEFAQGYNAGPNPLDRALAAAQRAVELASTHALGHYALATVHFFRKEMIPFRVLAERALNLNPLDASVKAYLGMLIASSGEWDRGCQLVESAMQLNPNCPGYFHFAGAWNSYRQGKYAEVLEDAARSNMPGYYHVPAIRAAALAQLGRQQEARMALNDLLALRPDFAQAARQEYAKWAQPELVEQLLDGLRKAGLDVPGPEIPEQGASPSTIVSAPSQLKSQSGSTNAVDLLWLAVLPFRPQGASSDLAALAHGLTEDIVTAVGRFSRIRVIASSNTEKYAGKSTDTRVVGKELGARYVLEGNLRQAGASVRLTVQLVDTVDGTQLWAETLNRPFHPDDIFALQDELVPRIVSKVADSNGVLVRALLQVVMSKKPSEMTAYEASVAVNAYSYRLSAETHAFARAAVERAVKVSPGDGRVWFGLAGILAEGYSQGWNDEPNLLDRALEAARRAVNLIPEDAHAHRALCCVLTVRKEYRESRIAGERALALNPLDGMIAAHVGLLFALSGEWDRGCELIAQAMKLNPIFPGWFWIAPASNAYRLQDYQAALDHALKMNLPGLPLAWAILAAIHGQLGQVEPAAHAVRQLLLLRPDYASIARDFLGRLFDSKVVEDLIDGLRKAGLAVPGPEAPEGGQNPASSSKAEISGKLTVASQSIAVLPFANMSADPDQEYFSDGLAEEIINALTHVSGLKVIARTSAFSFKGRNEDIRRIAEVLGVTNVLEGSVRRAGSRIRVTAQLIQAADGTHLWSERFDRELADVFAVQDEIAAAIARALKVTLHGPTSRGHQPSLPAYEAFLKGRHHYYKFSPEAFSRAEVEFQRAAALDSQWADPHSALSDLYLSFGFYGWRPPDEMTPLARSSAHRALELLPSDPMAHSVLAAILGLHDRDWADAKRHFLLAQAGEARSINAIFFCAAFHLLPLGRFDEARSEMEKVVILDPLSAFWRARLAWISLNEGRYEDAIAICRAALDLDENNYQARMILALALYCIGHTAEALVEIKKAYQIAPFDSFCTGQFAGMLANSGDQARANELIANMTGAIPVGKMMYHLLCSEIDSSLNWFEKDLELRRFNAPMLAFAAFLAPLRSSPRWHGLMRTMGLA